MKAAIFDMDGTILDSMPYWADTGLHYLATLGIKADPQLGEQLKTLSLIEGAEYLRKVYGISKTNEEIIAGIKNTIADAYKNLVQPKKGAVEFLAELKQRGIPAALATATDANMFMPAFERLSLNQYFDFILTCSQYKTSKSEPLIFQKAAELLKSKPEETFVFEDAPHAILTAFKAGFKTCGIQDDSANGQEAEMKKYSTVYFDNFEEAQEFFF